jgi:hypothetical protein
VAEQNSTQNKRVWPARIIWLLAAIAGVYVLGGGAWFFAGLCLGWLGAVIEVAARP